MCAEYPEGPWTPHEILRGPWNASLHRWVRRHPPFPLPSALPVFSLCLPPQPLWEVRPPCLSIVWQTFPEMFYLIWKQISTVAEWPGATKTDIRAKMM